MRNVRVRNVTRGSTVAERAEVARTPLRRMLGMMGRRHWTEADGLLIEPCNSIHTLFMRMPIDVVFVSRAGEVLDVTPDQATWRLGPIVWRARYVLELPRGTIERSRTRLDDHLSIENVGEMNAP